MCGITGIYNFDRTRRVDSGMLAHMTDQVAHRGPDDAGYYVNENVGLGHRRLSIIDLSAAGNQPMPNEDRTVWLTCNGEIYNYQDFLGPLRGRGHRFRSHSDSEVLLHLYEEYGPRFVEKIDGMFAFCIWDSRRERMFLYRDRLGIKPLYYYHDRDHLVFASELKALVVDPAVPTALDYSALSSYLHLMSIPCSNAVFRDVKKLEPGHYLSVTATGIEQIRYWDVPCHAIDDSIDEAAAVGQLEEALGRSVRSHVMADVPVGAFLSGGVDSSAIVALASQCVEGPLETFSATFKGLADFDESVHARRVARHCGTRHHEFDLEPNLVEDLPALVWHADEPFAVTSAFALYSLSRMASEHVKVVLSGDGSDETLAGYVWRHAPPAPGLVGRLKRGLRDLGVLPRRGARPPTFVEQLQRFSTPQLQQLLTVDAGRQVTEAWRDNVAQRLYDDLQGEDEMSRRLYTETKSLLVSEMLTKVDRMTMAFGLEARVPFLDHHLVEWAFRLPSRFKVRGSEGKYVLKRAMERLLPAEILYRPKHGFNVPMELWLRGDLREFAFDLVGSRSARERGIFDPGAVTSLMDEHQKGGVDNSLKITIVFMLELWFRRFVDHRPTATRAMPQSQPVLPESNVAHPAS